MIHGHITTKAVMLLGASSGTLAFVASFAADSGTTVAAPWLTAGGTAASVTALAYVAKMLADGRLVSRPAQDQMASMTETVKEAQRREGILADLTKESHEREDRLWRLLSKQERQ